MSNNIRIELEQGFYALALTNHDGDQVWGCVYDSLHRVVKGTSGWYPTTKLADVEIWLRRVMAFERHGTPKTFDATQRAHRMTRNARTN